MEEHVGVAVHLLHLLSNLHRIEQSDNLALLLCRRAPWFGFGLGSGLGSGLGLGLGLGGWAWGGGWGWDLPLPSLATKESALTLAPNDLDRCLLAAACCSCTSRPPSRSASSST